MSESRHKIDVRTEEGATTGQVSLSVARPGKSGAVAVVAHGAGGNMDSPALRGLQSRLAASGVGAVRFNFLYAEKKKGGPDRQPSLVACWRSVADWVRLELEPKKLFLGGRSMGGRMASYLVGEGYRCDGLFFLAYPLHPPGKREQQRKDHLPAIQVPMLFVSGTRDAFANLDLLEPLVEELGATLHKIEDADHGFKVPKKSGRTSKEIDDEVARTVLAFVGSTGG